MQHGTLLRVLFHDGLHEVGAYNAFASDQHWLALAGFMRRFYRDHITDIFAYEHRHWVRKKGHVNAYDDYLARGGTDWPSTYFEGMHFK